MLKEDYLIQLRTIRNMAYALERSSCAGYERVKIELIKEEADKLITRLEKMSEKQYKLVSE